MKRPARAPRIIASNGAEAPEALALALADAGTLLVCREGQLLMTAGGTSSEVFVLLDGALRVTLFSLDGREMIIRDLKPAEMFGELAAVDGGRRSASIVALSDSQLLRIDEAVFLQLVFGTAEAAAWFAGHLVGQVRALTQRLFELSTLNVRSRLHCQLMRLCADAGVSGNRSEIEPFPTHEELADWIGSHREAVTRELRYLADIGVVAPGRRRLSVTDVDALAGMVRKALGPG